MFCFLFLIFFVSSFQFDPFKVAVTPYPVTEYQPLYFVITSFEDATRYVIVYFLFWSLFWDLLLDWTRFVVFWRILWRVWIDRSLSVSMRSLNAVVLLFFLLFCSFPLLFLFFILVCFGFISKVILFAFSGSVGFCGDCEKEDQLCPGWKRKNEYSQNFHSFSFSFCLLFVLWFLSFKYQNLSLIFQRDISDVTLALGKLASICDEVES